MGQDAGEVTTLQTTLSFCCFPRPSVCEVLIAMALKLVPAKVTNLCIWKCERQTLNHEKLRKESLKICKTGNTYRIASIISSISVHPYSNCRCFCNSLGSSNKHYIVPIVYHRKDISWQPFSLALAMNKPVFQIIWLWCRMDTQNCNWVNLVQSTFYSMPYNEDHQHFTWTETP